MSSKGNDMLDKISGCLFGSALGDALGASLEFLSYEEIINRHPTPETLHPFGDPIRVTDDTQMMIAVGMALLEANYPYNPGTFLPTLTRHFINWYESPDNNRAPGMTCLGSIKHLRDGRPWLDATDIQSKGCGANMRVQPVGLLPVKASTRSKIAQAQAALTHGHSTALAATDLTAWIIADLLNGGEVETLLKRLRSYVQQQQETYHQDWLEDLYQKALIFPTSTEFIARGWSECSAMVNRVEDALSQKAHEADPAKLIGPGWIAEEAFASALYCFLLYPDEPLTAIRRAVMSGGDSDSVACLTGAFSGVYCGASSLPKEWLNHLEYQTSLITIASHLATMWQEPKTS